MDYISPSAVGLTVSPGVSTATSALPVDAAGRVPHYVYLMVKVANCHVRIGLASVVATTNDLLLPVDHPVIIHTRGFTHIAYLGPVANPTLNITPLEA